MVNRRRQWVTEAELYLDLTALLRDRPSVRSDFRAPLSQAGIAVGRFFFVQRSQAISADTRLQTYEFLHATFGEYLAARLAAQLAAGLLDRRPALTVGHAPAADDLLYALLSFAPLSSRQMLRFVDGSCLRAVAAADRTQLAERLISVLANSCRRTGHRHEDYAPAPLATAARHGIYSANLVLLILILTGTVSGSRLFPGTPDPAGRWRRTTLLWRSALSEQDWTDLALALSLRRVWAGPIRELEVSLAAEPRMPTEPVDLYWHFRYPPDDDLRGRSQWARTYWDEVNYKKDMSGGTNDSVVRHAMEPVFRWLGPSVMTFQGIGDGPATSVAHDLLRLCLLRLVRDSDDELTILYRLLRPVFSLPTLRYATAGNRAAWLLLRLLHADVARIPATDVASLLDGAVENAVPHDHEVVALVPEVAVAALAVAPHDPGHQEMVRDRLAAAAVTAAAVPGRRAGVTPSAEELLAAVAEATRLAKSVIEADYPEIVRAARHAGP
jgi:hypothetical protein